MIVMKHGQYAEWPDIECPNCRKIGSIDVEMFSHSMTSVDINVKDDEKYELELSESKMDRTDFLVGLWCTSCCHDFTEEENNEVGKEVGLTFYHTKLAAVTAMLEAEGYRDVSIRHSKNKEVTR